MLGNHEEAGYTLSFVPSLRYSYSFLYDVNQEDRFQLPMVTQTGLPSAPFFVYLVLTERNS
jgi:hypothetical protein